MTTPGGTSAEVPADLYTYDPVPTVTALSVKEGPLAGATKVTITGTGFTKASTVSFGGTSSESLDYVSETELSAESPAGTGTVNVTVVTAGGTSATSPADDFSYVSTPTVSKLTPAEGPEAGKTTVTITGTGFTSTTAVSFGATPATKYKVESPTSILAESPAGNGTAAVTVETAGGTSAEVPADLYTYDPVPTVTALSVKEGPLAGATKVTITGTGFTKASTVSFGATKAKASTYVSETELSAESPAGTGTVNVTVVTAGGTSATSPADDFSYVSTPTVSKGRRAEGPEAGKTTVTITTTGFAGAAAVSFGATPATQYKVESPTSILAESPAGNGTAAVTVETAGGTSAEDPTDLYTYDPAYRRSQR